jgi:phosphoglycolate/pyridoxal phosphate phosphatase family enzyme
MPFVKYNAYIFDLDGTLYLGESLLPGAAKVLHHIRAAARPVLFLSNNPTQTPAYYAAKLTRLGIEAAETEVLNSTQVFTAWLARTAPGAGVFVLGEQPLCDALSTAGFELTEVPSRIQYVVASFDRHFNYHKLQVAFDAIRAGARLVATNADRYCPVPGGGQPDAAALIAALEACTGTTCELVAGKPSALMAETALQYLGVRAEQCLMTGDRLETDILMGVHAGMATALVLTGATSQAELPHATIRPTYILAHLDELLYKEAL